MLIRQLINGFVILMVLQGFSTHAATLEVGPGEKFIRIEEANNRARPGDLIRVYPRKNNQPYEKKAVFVKQKNIAFRAMTGEKNIRVKISGKGFDYSGVGKIPRVMFQFNRGADGCTLEGFASTRRTTSPFETVKSTKTIWALCPMVIKKQPSIS